LFSEAAQLGTPPPVYCTANADEIFSWLKEVHYELVCQMHILSLRNNDVGDNGAASLATCLSKLDVLDVNNSKITGGGAVNLKEAIDKLSAPVSFCLYSRYRLLSH